jgi:predicted DCC family thiol-disulfide oxidoreductase YuxK
MIVAAFSQPEAIIFYDGECGFCNRWVAFVLRHDPDGIFQFATLNSQTARTQIHNPELLNGSTVLLLTPQGTFTRSTAVLKIAAQLPGYKILARLLLKIPRTLRDRIYAFIARHRHALQPSQSPTCAFIPGVENRFLP